jgi:hypothetical protein
MQKLSIVIIGLAILAVIACGVVGSIYKNYYEGKLSENQNSVTLQTMGTNCNDRQNVFYILSGVVTVKGKVLNLDIRLNDETYSSESYKIIRFYETGYGDTEEFFNVNEQGEILINAVWEKSHFIQDYPGGLTQFSKDFQRLHIPFSQLINNLEQFYLQSRDNPCHEDLLIARPFDNTRGLFYGFTNFALKTMRLTLPSSSVISKDPLSL